MITLVPTVSLKEKHGDVNNAEIDLYRRDLTSKVTERFPIDHGFNKVENERSNVK